jgi:hypothetical protein
MIYSEFGDRYPDAGLIEAGLTRLGSLPKKNFIRGLILINQSAMVGCMRAKIILFDSALDCYTAVTNQNAVVFSVLLPAVLRIGDVLEGDIELYGKKSLTNITRGSELLVFVRELHRLARPFVLMN